MVQGAGRSRRFRGALLRRRRRAVLDELSWAAPGSAVVRAAAFTRLDEALLSLKYDVSLGAAVSDASRGEASRRLVGARGRAGGASRHQNPWLPKKDVHFITASRWPLRSAKKIDLGAAAECRQPPRSIQHLSVRKKSLYALKTSGFTPALLRR